VAAADRGVVRLRAVRVDVRDVAMNRLGVPPISSDGVVHGDIIRAVIRHGLAHPREVAVAGVPVEGVAHLEGGRHLKGRVEVAGEIGVLVMQVPGRWGGTERNSRTSTIYRLPPVTAVHTRLLISLNPHHTPHTAHRTPHNTPLLL